MGSFWELLKEFREEVIVFEGLNKKSSEPKNLDEFKKMWGIEEDSDEEKAIAKEKAKNKQYYQNRQGLNRKNAITEIEKTKVNKNYVGNFTLFKDYITVKKAEDPREFRRQYQWFYREYKLGRNPIVCPKRMIGQTKITTID